MTTCTYLCTRVCMRACTCGRMCKAPTFQKAVFFHFFRRFPDFSRDRRGRMNSDFYKEIYPFQIIRITLSAIRDVYRLILANY